jgi:hypothetical protein
LRYAPALHYLEFALKKTGVLEKLTPKYAAGAVVMVATQSGV